MDDEEKKEEKTATAEPQNESETQKVEEPGKEAEGAAEEAKESAEKAEGAAEESEEATKEVKEEVEEVKQETKPESTAPTPAPASTPPAKEEPKKEIKVSAKLAGIIKEIEGLTVLELADLVHALEQKFGVSAAAPVAAPAGGPAGSSEAAEQETQTTFNVILANSGANKISVIKAIRELVPTLGLKEAKDLVDTPPKPILQGAGKDAANEAKQKLETAGAKVELQ